MSDLNSAVESRCSNDSEAEQIGALRKTSKQICFDVQTHYGRNSNKPSRSSVESLVQSTAGSHCECISNGLFFSMCDFVRLYIALRYYSINRALVISYWKYCFSSGTNRYSIIVLVRIAFEVLDFSVTIFIALPGLLVRIVFV